MTVPLPEGDWTVIQGNGFAGSLEEAGIYLPPAQALFAEHDEKRVIGPGRETWRT